VTRSLFHSRLMKPMYLSFASRFHDAFSHEDIGNYGHSSGTPWLVVSMCAQTVGTLVQSTKHVQRLAVTGVPRDNPSDRNTTRLKHYSCRRGINGDMFVAGARQR